MKLIVLDHDKNITYIYTVDGPDKMGMLIGGDEYIEEIMTKNGHRIPGSYSDICPVCEKDADTTGYICNECGNWFETTEELSEYNARVKENHYEEMADAKRKYGE